MLKESIKKYSIEINSEESIMAEWKNLDTLEAFKELQTKENSH